MIFKYISISFLYINRLLIFEQFTRFVDEIYLISLFTILCLGKGGGERESFPRPSLSSLFASNQSHSHLHLNRTNNKICNSSLVSSIRSWHIYVRFQRLCQVHVKSSKKINGFHTDYTLHSTASSFYSDFFSSESLSLLFFFLCRVHTFT